MLIATALAGLGGFLWGFGILGKRLGVQGAQNHEKNIRATYTIFVYTLTTLIAPLIDFASTDRSLIKDTFTDEQWVRRIPVIIVCGLISGLGGVLGTIAFAWSAGVSSALISMVENGMYTISGAVLIALQFREHPSPFQYLSAALIVGGILVAQISTGRPKRPLKQGSDELDSNSSGSDRSNPDTIGSGESDESRESSSGSDANAEPVAIAGRNRMDSLSSNASDSSIAPTLLRKRAVIFAVLAGTCWGFGPVGKKYGVADAPDEVKHVRTTCTYLVYISATVWVPILKLLCSNRELRSSAIKDRGFQWLLAGTMCCGIVSGLGGLISTLAFAHSGGEGALVSVIENGVYTVSGALMITVLFKEIPTKRQIASACLVVVGLLVSAAGK
mmetsp:Transcript_61605/g.199478  ORF Transcript_61605/g.199478 Transcript_61605/m.199478 type:complete len:388 (+) Transcript_61605:67-1230(+)